MKAVFLNGSLKDSSHTSNTDALADEVMQIWEEEGVQVEKIRLADYNIPYGVADDLHDGGHAALFKHRRCLHAERTRPAARGKRCSVRRGQHVG